MTEANISWITDQIATGGDFSFNPEKAQRQFMDLLSQDIDLVIDCRIEASDHEVWDTTDVDYLHLPVNDIYGQHLPMEHFDAAVEAARPVLESGGKVFVHCHMGINRGPSTAYALLLDQGVPSTKAFDMIRKARPQAAVYYAEDALKAHLHRRWIVGAKARARLQTFRDHHKRVFTKKDWAAVQHVIRSNHEQDSVDIIAARA